MARNFSNEPLLRSSSVDLRFETMAMDSSSVSSHRCSNTHKSAEDRSPFISQTITSLSMKAEAEGH
jgi:hypothetical protein